MATEETGIVAGRVVDRVSGRPIAGAQITLVRRVVVTTDGGSVHLLPAARGIDLGIAVSTDAHGEYRVEVPIVADQPYIRLGAAASGYQPLANMLARVSAGEPLTLAFELVPLDPSPEEIVQIEQRHALDRAEMYRLLESGGEGPGAAVAPAARAVAPKRARRRPSEAAMSTTYFVPDEVFVSSLPQSGFTGFIDFDEFLAGVVAAEMGDSFPIEALKNQAIASRTYALERHERTGVANGGQAYTAFFAPLGQSFVAAGNTSKGVLLYQSAAFPAFFSARCNGDVTLDSEDGLSCIPGGCADPCEVGGLLPFSEPLPYARSRPCSGHVNCSMTTEPCCVVSIDARVHYIYGHGVGMCQRGAQQLACRDGRDATEIVGAYYSDVVLANSPGVHLGDRVETTTGVNARAAPCDSDRVLVPQGSFGTVVAGPSHTHCPQLGSCLGDAGTYWTWWQVDFDGGPVGRWLVEDFLLDLSPGPPETACAAPLSGADGPKAGDCLFVLQVATGLGTCEPECICAPTGELPPQASDALLCLMHAVGHDVTLACPC